MTVNSSKTSRHRLAKNLKQYEIRGCNVLDKFISHVDEFIQTGLYAQPTEKISYWIFRITYALTCESTPPSLQPHNQSVHHRGSCS